MSDATAAVADMLEQAHLTGVPVAPPSRTSAGVVLGSVPSPVLGSPINALVWLANTIGPRGVVLEPDAVVLPGSLTAAVDAHPGDTVTATFGRLGSVTATFTRSPEEH